MLDGSKSVHVFWQSDPVAPGETVMLEGENLHLTAGIDLARLPDQRPAGQAPAPAWRTPALLKQSRQVLMFAVPRNMRKGAYAYRLRLPGGNFYAGRLNLPEIWWMQGDLGANPAPGGWLRVFGRNFRAGRGNRIRLARTGARGARDVRDLRVTAATAYDVTAAIPSDLAAGDYEVQAHNGYGGGDAWQNAGRVRIETPADERRRVFNVVETGAQPNGTADSTQGVLLALRRAEAAGGGIVYFPRGRYRLDWPKRARYSVAEPLKIPRHVALQGAGMELVSLHWTERAEPLSSLIEGGDDFAVEDLTVYTQGRHNTIIAGGSNVRISRVRIRANCCYRAGTSEAKYAPAGYREHQTLGDAVRINGRNFAITDCDIYHSTNAINLSCSEYGVIARNKLYHSTNFLFASSCRRVIFEENECRSNSLFAHGGTWAIGTGKWVENLYFARNRAFHHYGGDRENITTDNHGTAYLGGVEKVSGRTVRLAGNPVWGTHNKDMLPSWEWTALYVLAGKGAGQCRRIAGCRGRTIELADGFAVAPDKTSVLSIGVYNGRSLFIGNHVEDAGSVVQLYPPNCECIVAENTSARGGNINCGGQLTRLPDKGILRVEPSWRNQFLDNVILEGNGWGAGGADGTAAVNGVLGGGAQLNIYGENSEPWNGVHISRCHVVRRHRAENNSSILIDGNVANAIVEKSVIKNNEAGVIIRSRRLERKTAGKAPIAYNDAPAMVVERLNQHVAGNPG